MGNIGTMVKRFLSNKNTVTLIAIIVCTVILYACYNWRVKSAVTTTYVCAAVETIPAREQITNEMVSTVKVLSSTVRPNMITSCDQVIGKYASYASEIPANSYFFNENVLTKDQMPNSSFDDIPDGYNIFNLAVTFESTYGNSVFPDDYIDIYLRTTDPDSDLLVYGKFIQSIKVLGVKDSDGKNVFETTIEARTPAQLLFAVPEDLYLLLKKAEYLGLELVLVPKNSNYTAEAGETLVSSVWLKELVLNQTADIPDECILNSTGSAECNIADINPDDNNNSNTGTDNNNNNNNDNNNNNNNQE